MGRKGGEATGGVGGGGKYHVSNTMKIYHPNSSYEELRGPVPHQCDVNLIEGCLV